MAKKTGFNKYKIIDDYVIIYFKRKKDDIELEGYIDLKDLQKFINQEIPYSAVWHPNPANYYAKATEYIGTFNGKPKYKIHYMHHDIVGNHKGMKVDHENHNTLDNRRNNLRITESTNNSTHRKGANKNNKTTGVRNVCYIERDNKYVVQMMKEGERFKWDFPSDQFEEACEFAIKKREELYGEFSGES
jgi:hypothetical protein